MRALVVGIALTTALSLAVPVQAQQRDTGVVSEVRTSGSAQRSVPPDLATLNVQLSAAGATEVEAGARLASRIDSIRLALGTLGIPRDSLPNRSRWWWWQGRVTTAVSSKCVPVPHKPTEPDHCAMQWDTTYRAADAIQVRIHDLSRIGAVIDTLMGRRVMEISEVQFTTRDVSAARLELLREATQRARAEAEAIASAGGLALGRVLSIRTESADPENYDWNFNGVGVAGGVVPRNAAPTEIVEPNLTVSVTVYGKWELVKKP
ncbi:MAG TPA: SIMPL domain-containing protein [Gemmatimonadales bacterium]|nr:SIMPL domain-containing protein [Gemmatimonadales bacterium]